MIRVLILIAVAGFLVSAVTLSAAVAITGPDAIAHGAWSFGPHGWGWRHAGGRSRAGGPDTARDLDWPGGDRLVVSVPAEVTYAQTDGPAKVTVSGPADAVADVRVDGGEIRYAGGDRDDQRLRIGIAAPAVTDFSLEGDDRLTISGYRQDRLALSVSGHADVRAAGEARDAQVRISGSGRADLSAVKTRSAEVGISGSGEAFVAPTDSADIEITGAGEVTLLTSPPHLRTHVTGAGQIRQPGG